jgi:hypothetical protein
MKQWYFLLAVALAGCTPGTEEAAPPSQTAPAQPAKTAAKPAAKPAAKLTTAQELAKYCRVCVVDKGERMEEFFPSRLDTKKEGRTYKFCSDDCKKKFDANSKRYALK